MDSDTIKEYAGVWIVIEQTDGVPAGVSLELLGTGRILADKLGTDVTALLIGENVSGTAQELIHYGADTVILIDDPIATDYRTEVYTDIIVKQAAEHKPEILMVGATCLGRDLAPRVAARLGTGCTADCTELDIDTETGLMVATKPYFGRDLMADIVCPHHRPQMVTVRPGVMELRAPDARRQGEVVEVKPDLREKDIKVKVLDTVRSASHGMSLEAADTVVAGGIGIGDPEGFERLNELAGLLGAAVGATSLPVDAGWISKECQIGQTAKTIRPRLYIGCGISGAIQHSAGMIHSECIVAVNTNPEAEIFSLADYGIVGDVNKIVPALIDELKNLKE